MTVRKYLDILQATFMIHIYQPWYENVGKRLVKRPKIYFRDSGLLHALLSLETKPEIQSHPKLGASWEGFVMEIITRSINLPESAFYFWRTQHGAELDLFWQNNGHNWGVEIKYSDAPRLTPSMKNALTDLKLSHIWVIYPGNNVYKIHEKITVLPLMKIKQNWEYHLT
jgi:predicted AAA+ superfamily ATPase